MIRWNHQLNGCEFEQTLGDNGRQRRLEDRGSHPWDHKESDMTYRLTNEQFPYWEYFQNQENFLKRNFSDVVNHKTSDPKPSKQWNTNLDWAVTVSRGLENANIHPWQQVQGHTCFSSLAIETLLCHPMRAFPVLLVLVYECIIWGSIQILTFFIGCHVIHLKLDAETCFFGKLHHSSKVYI